MKRNRKNPRKTDTPSGAPYCFGSSAGSARRPTQSSASWQAWPSDRNNWLRVAATWFSQVGMVDLRALITVAALLVGSSCAAPPTSSPRIATLSTFDPAASAYINEKGENAIRGAAFLRTRSGGVITCAGQEVRLFPRTAYVEERFMNLYGAVDQPAQLLFQEGRFPDSLDSPDPRAAQFDRRTVCDTQGQLEFTDVADGDYFVLARVWWTIGGIREGGTLLAPISVNGGETLDIVLGFPSEI